MEIIKENNHLRLTGETNKFFFDKKKGRAYGFLRVSGIDRDVYFDFEYCKYETTMFPHAGDIISFTLFNGYIGPAASNWWFNNVPPIEYRILEKRNSEECKIISSGRLEDLIFPKDLNGIKFSKREWTIPTIWEDCPDPRIISEPESEFSNQINFSQSFFHILNESLCG